jgi:hypothetical protein
VKEHIYHISRSYHHSTFTPRGDDQHVCYMATKINKAPY